MTEQTPNAELLNVPEGYAPLQWFRGFSKHVGPIYEKRGPEGLVRAFRVEEHLTNGMMNAHGGMVMAFADMAWGGAVERDEDTWWVTVRLTCDFLAGAPMGGWIEGSGKVLGMVDDIYTVDGRIWCGDKTLMRGTGIFKTIQRRD